MTTRRDPISARAKAVDASGIRKVFDLAAKLENPINLSIGLPDFDVPDVAKTAAVDAIEAGFNRYTLTQGIPELRERLKADLDAEMGRDVGDLFIASGVSGALMLAILALVDPGDEVVFLDPYFVMYRHLVTMAGGKSVAVDSYPDFRFKPDRVEAAITDRTKLLIVNSPSNPTGVTMTPDEVRAAAQLADKHGITLLSDEIYDAFRYDHTGDLYSPAALYDRTLILRGFSKTHGMTGWRVAYVAGPTDIIQQMVKLQQYSYVCAPSPFQKGALAALDVDMGNYIQAYGRKRDIVMEELAGTFELTRPDGAFYAFPKVPDGMTATEFCTRAIEKSVLTIPGNVFSGRDTHFRVSFATKDETLREGCKRLRELV